MNKILNKIASLALGLALAIGVGAAVSGSREATKVFASTDSAEGFSATDVKYINGSNCSTYTVNGNTGRKLGTSKASGDLSITVPANTTKLRIYAAAWSSDDGSSLKITKKSGATDATINPASITLTADSSISGSSTSITLNGTESSYKFDFDLNNVTEATTFNFATAAKKRCAIWSAQVITGSTTSPSVSWKTGSTKQLDYLGSEGFGLEALAENFSGTLTWTWSASPTGIVSIEDIDEIALINPVSAGKTTITAQVTDGTNTKSLTCDVTVTSKSGLNIENPLTVADAILIANHTGSTETTTSYYMEGLVTGTYNDAGKFPMLGDLEIYKDCSGTVYTGDTIRVYGPIMLFKTTPEFTSASTVEVIKIPVSSISASLSTPIITGVSEGNLGDYLSVTVTGTNSRNATDESWKVTNSSDTSVISISGSDGKTFNSSSTVGTTTLTIASVDDSSKTTTIEVTLFDNTIPVLQDVTVSGTPTKPTQYAGKTFDWSGLTFTPVYSPVKESTETITGNDIVWDDLVAGQNPTGTYTGDNDVKVTVTVTSVSVEADGVYSVHVSGDMSTKSYDEDASWDYDGLVVKVTYKSDHDTQVIPTSAITWTASSTPKLLGVGSGKSIDVTATVDGVSSEAYTVSGLTITEHVAQVYQLYSGALTEGDYVITSESQVALKNTVSTKYIGYTDVSSVISDSSITDPDSSIIWHVAQEGDYWTIYNEVVASYAASTGVKNAGQILETPVSNDDSNKILWSCDSTDSSTSYDFVNKYNKNTSKVNDTLRYNSGYGFATYGTTTGKTLSLYKLGFTAKTLSSISIESMPTKTAYNVGDALDLTGLVVKANWSDGSSTEIPSKDYTATPANGTSLEVTNNNVTISYTFNGTEKTTSFDITVSEVPMNEKDKILDKDTLNLNGTSYTANNGAHKVDGSSFTTNQVMFQKNSMQFQSGKGVISNSEVLYDGDSGNIKFVTVFMNSANGDTIIVSESSDGVTFNEVAVSGEYSLNGINVYRFTEGSKYFKVSSNSTVSLIDRIVIELVDNASTSLTKARNAAKAILTNLTTLCGLGGTGEVSQAQWNALTTAANNALGDDEVAKNILKSATRIAVDDLSLENLIIENAMFHYDACVEKFGFAEDSSISSAQASIKAPYNVTNEVGNPIALLTIISLVGLAAGGYFFIRRRKEQ